jgi:hypothetical protein
MAAPPPYPGTPRWVKLSGIIGIVLVLLVATTALAATPRRAPLPARRCRGPRLTTRLPEV